MRKAKFKRKLKDLLSKSKELLWPSESDYPLEYVELPENHFFFTEEELAPFHYIRKVTGGDDKWLYFMLLFARADSHLYIIPNGNKSEQTLYMVAEFCNGYVGFKTTIVQS